MKTVDLETAVSVIRSNSRVYLHEASMTPVSLVEGLCARADELRDVEIVHLHTDAPAPYAEPSVQESFRHNALFVGSNVRGAVQEGRADFTPVFLSEVPQMFENGDLPLDVAMVQVSPPDEHGFCRLGLSVACALPAVACARVVIAEINPQVPRTMGNSAIHVDEIDLAVEVERQLPQHAPTEPSVVDDAIGELVAQLIPNGATLQMGIGSIPNAVLAALHRHDGLGVHTEMFSDGLVDLVRAGVVNNRNKPRFRRRCVVSFATGSEKLFRFVHDNPFVEFHPSDTVNDPNEIRKQSMMTAINSALEIDLTGQVCADSVGERIFSGIGGQMDFVQGALRSPGGKAIIALPSTARGGTVSRIVPTLKPGAGVVTTRGHVQWVVTEHGAVNLRGRTLRERAELLIGIAAPAFRDELRIAARNRGLAR